MSCFSVFSWSRQSSTRFKLLVFLLAGSTLSGGLRSLALDEGHTAIASKTQTVSPQKRQGFGRTALPPSAQRFYLSTWGVEIVGVKSVESGSLLRFSYRVLDAEKARPLNDKKSTPVLYDLTTHSRLEVPSMEKVGQLRQSSAVEPGHIYWMVFSNPERYVKPGARVDIKIGNFLAQGLLVE
jgi:hypothetical protein